jgi:hypothetical protein
MVRKWSTVPISLSYTTRWCPSPSQGQKNPLNYESLNLVILQKWLECPQNNFLIQPKYLFVAKRNTLS